MSRPHRVDVKNDYVQTHVVKESALDHGAVQTILDIPTDRARQALGKEGFAAAEHQFERTIDVRYVGQAYEVRVAAPEDVVDEAYAAQVADAGRVCDQLPEAADHRPAPSVRRPGGLAPRCQEREGGRSFPEGVTWGRNAPTWWRSL